jgi:hypothetical protein
MKGETHDRHRKTLPLLLLIISCFFRLLIRKKNVSLSKNCKTDKFKVMVFNERLKQLRKDRQISQRKPAAALDIDTVGLKNVPGKKFGF